MARLVMRRVYTEQLAIASEHRHVGEAADAAAGPVARARGGRPATARPPPATARAASPRRARPRRARVGSLEDLRGAVAALEPDFVGARGAVGAVLEVEVEVAVDLRAAVGRAV